MGIEPVGPWHYREIGEPRTKRGEVFRLVSRDARPVARGAILQELGLERLFSRVSRLILT